MKNFTKILMVSLILTCNIWEINAQLPKVHANRQEPAIAVMYAHPEMAEEYARETIKTFAPNPESLKIVYCQAKYATLYKAYIVNCKFETEDAYGDLQSYKIQMKVQILPDGNGDVKYNALDFKEIR